MAWIESHQSLASHRKTKAFKRLLDIKTPQAVGHLHLLWWWALDNAQDGNLAGINPKDLADVAEWTGNAEKFLDALKVSGFLDDDFFLHDWDEYAGKLITKRRANSERVKRHRNALRNADVMRTSPVRNGATVPNSTVQYPITPLPPLTAAGEKVPDKPLPENNQETDTSGEKVEKEKTSAQKEKDTAIESVDLPPEQEPELTAIAVCYEQNLGPLTPVIAEQLRDIAKEYPPGWFQDAVKVACKANVRRLSYVTSILERWTRDGKGAKTRAADKKPLKVGATADELRAQGWNVV